MSATTNVTITGPRTPHEKANDKKKAETDQNIQVFIRARPLDASRNERKSGIEVDPIRREVRIPERAGEKGCRIFTYDNVFDASCGQYEIYDNVVSPLVHEVLAGYNCTVFAYGQTGTGKTYTMEGERSDYDCGWEDDPKSGIVPRALDQLFELLKDTGGEHTVAVSYMELYNENLFDLLAPNEDLVKLNIYEDNLNKGKVKVGGLAEVSVHAKNEIYEILQKGSAKRQTAATKLNACSSRSHTIFAVTVRMKDVVNLMDGEEVYRIGKLNLVDLAGSENIGRSGAVDKRAAEAGNINKSLLTLGRVITSLVDKNSHIPYRESKLTRLLQDSLGGRTKTSIIATVSPNVVDMEDSISTLEYAQRAKKITNKPELNQKMTKNTVLKELTAEIERLRRDVEAGRGGTNAFFISKENHESLLEKEKELSVKEQMVKDLEVELEKVKCLFGETQALLEKKSEILIKTENTLHDTRTDLHKTKVTLTKVTDERDEKEFLVKTHVHTEEKLSSQAKELVSVANTATDHVGRLHAKVDRVLAVEDSNIAKAANHVHDVVEGMKTTSELIKKIDTGFLLDTEKRLKKGSDSIQSGLDQVSEKLQQIESSLKDQISSHIQRYSSGSSELTDCLNLATAAIELVRREQHNSVTALKELFMQQTQDVNSEISKVMQNLSQEREKEEQMLMKQSELMEQSKNIRAQVASDLKQGIADAFACHKTQLDFLKQQVQELTTRLSQQAVSRRSVLENCMKRVLDEFSEAEKVNEADTSSHVSTISVNIDQQSQNSDSRMSRACGDVDTKFVIVETNENSRLEHNNSIDRCIAEHFQQRVDRLQELHSHSQEQNEKLQSLLDSQSHSQTQNLANVFTLQSDLKQKISEIVDDGVQSLQSLERDMTVKTSQTVSRVASAVQHVDDLMSDLNRELIVEKIHMNAVEKELLHELEQRSQDVIRLTEELHRDVPTGQTPQKVTYTYPTDLVRTSPHERILTRYRQNRIEALTELAAECELPDENSDDLNSRPPSASSSDSGADGENQQPGKVMTSLSKLPKIKSSGSLPRIGKHAKKTDGVHNSVPEGDVLRTRTAN